MTAIGIAFFPWSWAWGFWRKPHKTLFAVGPLRFIAYRTQAEWRS